MRDDDISDMAGRTAKADRDLANIPSWSLRAFRDLGVTDEEKIARYFRIWAPVAEENRTLS